MLVQYNSISSSRAQKETDNLLPSKEKGLLIKEEAKTLQIDFKLSFMSMV